ncbi:MAG: hypothetical protein NXI32_23370 [bacterium]|nr:hypothetical protein [bacterium]
MVTCSPGVAIQNGNGFTVQAEADWVVIISLPCRLSSRSRQWKSPAFHNPGWLAELDRIHNHSTNFEELPSARGKVPT